MSEGYLSLQAQWGVGGMTQQQVNSKKDSHSSFHQICTVSSCQTHKNRTWELGAAIEFLGIHIFMLGTVWNKIWYWCLSRNQFQKKLTNIKRWNKYYTVFHTFALPPYPPYFQSLNWSVDLFFTVKTTQQLILLRGIFPSWLFYFLQKLQSSGTTPAHPPPR